MLQQGDGNQTEADKRGRGDINRQVDADENIGRRQLSRGVITQVDTDENSGRVLGVQIHDILDDSNGQMKHTRKAEEDLCNYGWFCVLGCSVVHFMIAGSEKSSGLVFLVLRERFTTSAATTALITSLGVGLRLILGPLGSILGNRFTPRKVAMVGGCLYMISYVSSVDPPNLYMLYFTYGLLSGVGGALCQGNSIIMIAKYFKQKLSIANAFAMAGGGIGTLTFPILVQLLLEEYGYFGYMLITGALMSNLIVCGALYRPVSETHPLQDAEHKAGNGDGIVEQKWDETSSVKCAESSLISETIIAESFEDLVLAPSQQETGCINEDGEQQGMLESNQQQEGDLKLAKKDDKSAKTLMHWALLKDPKFLLASVCSLFNLMGINIGFLLLPALAEEDNIEREQSAILISIIGVSDLCGRLSIGIISDIPCVKPYREHLYCAACFIMGLMLVMLPQCSTYGHYICVCILFGLFEGMVVSQRSVMLADLLGLDKYASSIGLNLFFAGLGALAGPFLGGAIQDIFKQYQYSFAFAGVVVWIGAFCFLAEIVLFNVCRKKESVIIETVIR